MNGNLYPPRNESYPQSPHGLYRLPHPQTMLRSRVDKSNLLSILHPAMAVQVKEPGSNRVWEVCEAFAPLPENQVGGCRFRCKLVAGYTATFYSFISQRDLEVLIFPQLVNQTLPWSDLGYVSPSSSLWEGFRCKARDFCDDLWLRENALRVTRFGDRPIETGTCVTRYLIHAPNSAFREVLSCKGDVDKYSGYGPCMSAEDIVDRWVVTSKDAVQAQR